MQVPEVVVQVFGVLLGRHLVHPRGTVFAGLAIAFRPLETVNFPSLRLEDYPVNHDSTYFGAPSRGLHPRSIQLRTPVAGCARGCHYRPAGQAFVRWDLHPYGAHPPGNHDQFHGIAPNSKVSGLPWHDQCLVRCSCSYCRILIL